MKTDLAVVNFAPERYSVDLREVPIATINDDQVLLEVQSVGVCGSDLHMWTAQQSWLVNYPVVLGHEFCGIICQVGKNVKGWSEGDRVVSETAAIIDAQSVKGAATVAIRLPSDESVRTAFRVLADAGAEIVGASDHGVSHSLYIKDPDGIELELYADVPGWEEHGDEVATIRPWDPR